MLAALVEKLAVKSLACFLIKLSAEQILLSALDFAVLNQIRMH